jgi:hypothetical protein
MLEGLRNAPSKGFELEAARPFVDKATSGGHNENASLELQPRLCWGFTHSIRARMAELADAQVSEACDLTVVEVRVLFRAPTTAFCLDPLVAHEVSFESR